MAAEKVVLGVTATGAPLRMEWQKPERDRYFWRPPVEVEAARVGELMLFVNPNFARSWFFKLGDLMHADGFRLYSVLDDRESLPDEDVAGLLVQVSRVVQWSRQEDWLSGLREVD